MNDSVRTTAGTPVWVFQSASCWNVGAIASLVMMTYWTGLPRTDGTCSGLNGSACGLPAASRVTTWLDAETRARVGMPLGSSSSHSRTMRSRVTAGAAPSTTVRRSCTEAIRSSCPVEGFQRVGAMRRNATLRPRWLPCVPTEASCSGRNPVVAYARASATVRSPGPAPGRITGAGATRTPSRSNSLWNDTTSTLVTFMPAGRSTRSATHGRSGRPGVNSCVPPKASIIVRPWLDDTRNLAASSVSVRSMVRAEAVEASAMNASATRDARVRRRMWVISEGRSMVQPAKGFVRTSTAAEARGGHRIRRGSCGAQAAGIPLNDRGPAGGGSTSS